MRLIRSFRLRRHRAEEEYVDTPMPSGYYTSSGVGDAFLRLTDRVDRDYPETPLTPDLIEKAMAIAPQKAGA